MEPKLAIDSTKEAFDLFRRDYLVASVVVLFLVNGIWAWAFSRVWGTLNQVQGQRVQDQIDGERRAQDLVGRMALHMDRSTEATVLLLNKSQRTPNARTRSGDVPALGAEPASQVKKLPEGGP